MNFKNWTVEQLKTAIWDLINGIVPMCGICDIEVYRNELIRRGENGKGWHE